MKREIQRMIPPNPRSDELDQRKSRVVRIDPFEMPLEPFSRGIFLAKSFVFGGDDPQNDRLERANLLVNSRMLDVNFDVELGVWAHIDAFTSGEIFFRTPGVYQSGSQPFSRAMTVYLPG